MIPKQKLTGTVRTTRTYRFRIRNPDYINHKFLYVQKIKSWYFNYGLKYLYQHYGVAHLNSRFPAGKQRQYLINRMVSFARKRTITPWFNLKNMDYNVQSVDKMLESLCVNFIRYRKGQYKRIHYWSSKDTVRYLKTHRCTLSGYGRISFKHHLNDIRSVTFKQNHNRIHLVNNYALKVPYFGNIQVSKSLTSFKHQKITEVKLIKRRTDDYELQIVIKFIEQRHVNRKMTKDIIGLDVNSKDDKFFALSNKKVISWPKSVKNRYFKNDIKSRDLQHYITEHNHGNDNSRRTRSAKRRLQKLKAKTTFLIDHWQLHVVHRFAKEYPVLSMEQLSTFTMRVSKRDKRYNLRKNTNHKLATIHPTKFRKQMEDIYQDNHALLLEVDPYDTSKTCHNDGTIHDIGLKKRWWCNHCQHWIPRDYNSTLNIRDWAVKPSEHAAWRLHKKYGKFPWLKKARDLVTTF